MRTPAQKSASRANGALSRGPKTPDGKLRAAAKPFLHDQLAKATVVKKESREGFQELVRQYMHRIAPRDPVEQAAVEEICSATWRLYRLRAIERKAIDLELAAQASPDDLECLLHACGALAGKNPNFHLLLQRHETRLQNIIRRALARIQALRRIGPQKDFAQITPVEPPSGGASSAPKPLSMRLRTHIRVPRTSPCGIPGRTQEEPKKNPGRTQEEPTDNPPEPKNPESGDTQPHPPPPQIQSLPERRAQPAPAQALPARAAARDC